MVTTFEYQVDHDTQPHKWECQKYQRRGWIKVPRMCEARCCIDEVKPITRANICVVHREGGNAFAWGDASGSELDPKLAIAARDDEMEQFRKHGAREKVKEEVCWNVTGKGQMGARWIDINKGDEANPEYRPRLVAQQIKYNSKEKNIC